MLRELCRRIAFWIEWRDWYCPRWVGRIAYRDPMTCACFRKMGMRTSGWDGTRYPYCSWCDGN